MSVHSGVGETPVSVKVFEGVSDAVRVASLVRERDTVGSSETDAESDADCSSVLVSNETVKVGDRVRVSSLDEVFV